jgi:hypothetical protein
MPPFRFPPSPTSAIALGAGGASEVSGKAVDFGLGSIETFMIDNLKIGWSPKAYFNGLRKLFGLQKKTE